MKVQLLSQDAAYLVGFAKKKLRQLREMRLQTGQPIWSKYIKVDSISIYLETSDWGDKIRLSGGSLMFVLAAEGAAYNMNLVLISVASQKQATSNIVDTTAADNLYSDITFVPEVNTHTPILIASNKGKERFHIVFMRDASAFSYGPYPFSFSRVRLGTNAGSLSVVVDPPEKATNLPNYTTSLRWPANPPDAQGLDDWYALWNLPHSFDAYDWPIGTILPKINGCFATWGGMFDLRPGGADYSSSITYDPDVTKGTWVSLITADIPTGVWTQLVRFVARELEWAGGGIPAVDANNAAVSDFRCLGHSGFVEGRAILNGDTIYSVVCCLPGTDWLLIDDDPVDNLFRIVFDLYKINVETGAYEINGSFDAVGFTGGNAPRTVVIEDMRKIQADHRACGFCSLSQWNKRDPGVGDTEKCYIAWNEIGDIFSLTTAIFDISSYLGQNRPVDDRSDSLISVGYIGNNSFYLTYSCFSQNIDSFIVKLTYNQDTALFDTELIYKPTAGYLISRTTTITNDGKYLIVAVGPFSTEKILFLNLSTKNIDHEISVSSFVNLYTFTR